jgi:hypothetical protein
LVRRLERLEARTEPERLTCFRYGWLKRLPQDFSGERHVVMLKREPVGSARAQWCEFEERAGPAPEDCMGEDSTTVHLAER